MPINDRIILGIDPGTVVMGYGLIHVKNNKVEPIGLGVIKLDKYDDLTLRLKKIFERTIGIIEEFKPDELAIEAPFFGKNVQSMLKLGRKAFFSSKICEYLAGEKSGSHEKSKQLLGFILFLKSTNSVLS